MAKDLAPVLFEVLRHRIEEIVAEAYYTLARCSGNPIIADSGDHEEALLDANGSTVMVAGGIVEWTYSLEAAGKHLIEAYTDNPGIYDGDQFVFTDCYKANVHHMDIQVLSPIFWEGRRVAWIVTAGHTMDIGGIDPAGYMLRAENVFQEGLHLPGIKIVERGVRRKDVEDSLKGMTRQPDLFMLDISARIAANNVSSKRLKETFEKYGIDTVLTVFQELQDYSERLARAKLRKIPDGTWHAVHYMEPIREEESYLKLELTATKENDELTLDFTGSSPQSRGSQNIAKPGTMSNALCSYLTMFAYDIPWSSGVWRPIKWIIPDETIVNPKFPAAVSTNTPSGGGTETIILMQDIMAQMLLSSEELKEDVYAGVSGGFTCTIDHGLDKAGELFITVHNMDVLICGMGALADRDGEEACANVWTPKSQVDNLEALEELFPWLFLCKKEVIDTGGSGKFRGGVGTFQAVIPWDTDSSIELHSLGLGYEARGTYGLAGGYPSTNSLQMIIRDSDILEQFRRREFLSDVNEINGKRENRSALGIYKLNPGDVLIQYQNGGGGFGDPIDRDPRSVAKDVERGYVSLETAKETYGVLIDPDTFEVNHEATEERRQAITTERLRVGRK